MAFQNHRGGRPLCPSIIARNITTLIARDLHPLGGPEIWSGNPIATTLTLSIPITTDEDGCPTPSQPYTRVNRILRKLIFLWERKIFTWEQIARLSPNKRLYLLSDEEILWANPHLRNKIHNTLQKAILYLRINIQADSSEYLLSLTLTLSKPDPQSTFLAARWLGLLASTLATLPLGPTQLQLLSATTHLDITTCFEKTAERARLAKHTTRTTRQPIHVTIIERTKRNRPATRTPADPTPIDNPCPYPTKRPLLPTTHR